MSFPAVPLCNFLWYFSFFPKSDRPHKFTERPRPGVQTVCSSFSPGNLAFHLNSHEAGGHLSFVCRECFVRSDCVFKKLELKLFNGKQGILCNFNDYKLNIYWLKCSTDQCSSSYLLNFNIKNDFDIKCVVG